MSDLQTVRARADELAARTREAWYDAGMDERTAAVAAGLAAAAAKLREAELDDRAAALGKKLRDSKAAQQAGERAREYSDKAVELFNELLEDTRAAERFGLKPVPAPKKRRPTWLLLLLAVGAALGLAAARKRSSSGGGTLEVTGPITSGESSVPAEPKPLAEKVRTAIGQDPRTRELPERLNINVVEGTVFVRGPVPDTYDEEDLRTVVASVDGVTDVDLQVSRSS